MPKFFIITRSNYPEYLRSIKEHHEQNYSAYCGLAKEYYDKLTNPKIEKEKKEEALTELEKLANSEEIDSPAAKFYFYKYAMALDQTNNARNKKEQGVLSLKKLITFYLKEKYLENYLVNCYLLPITDYHNNLSEDEKYYQVPYDSWGGWTDVATPLYKAYFAFSEEMKLVIEEKIDELLATTNQSEMKELLYYLKIMVSQHMTKNIYDLVFNNFHHLAHGNYSYFSEKIGQLLYSEKSKFSFFWFEKSNNYLMQARAARDGLHSVQESILNYRGDFIDYNHRKLPPNPQQGIQLYLQTIAESSIQDKQAALNDLKEMSLEGNVEAQEAYQSGVRQMLADLTQYSFDPASLEIKYAAYLEAVAYIETAIHSHPSASHLFLTRFLSAYPFHEYDSRPENVDVPHESTDETLRACIQGRSRLKNFIVDLDNKSQKAKASQFIISHSKSDQSFDLQPSKVKLTFNLDQLKLKAEKNDVIALCQLVQHFADKRMRMEKFSSQATLTTNIGVFSNREHSHFTAENYWLQLLYTMADHSLSPKERNEITLMADNGNAAAKLLLIFEVVCRESSSPREKLQAQSDLAQVMHCGGKVFDSVCEKIYADRSYVTPEFFTCLEKAGCFEDLSVSANMALPRLAA